MKYANLIHASLCATILLAAPAAHAEASGTDVKAALDTCAASVATDDNGRPDRTAMDACMTVAGFTKPLGRGGPGGRGGRGGNGGSQDNAGAESNYVDKAALEAALTECRSMVATDETGQPDRQAVDTCMEVKGFKKPAKEAGGRGHGRRSSGSHSRGSTSTSMSAK